MKCKNSESRLIPRDSIVRSADTIRLHTVRCTEEKSMSSKRSCPSSHPMATRERDERAMLKTGKVGGNQQIDVKQRRPLSSTFTANKPGREGRVLFTCTTQQFEPGTCTLFTIDPMDIPRAQRVYRQLCNQPGATLQNLSITILSRPQ